MLALPNLVDARTVDLDQWTLVSEPWSGGGQKRKSTWSVEADTSLLKAVKADYGGPVDAGRGRRWSEPT